MPTVDLDINLEERTDLEIQGLHVEQLQLSSPWFTKLLNFAASTLQLFVTPRSQSKQK